MNASLSTAARIQSAVAALGPGELDEAAVRAHIAPLFSRVLARSEIYLANHSLGRPLDASARDVAEAMELWQLRMGEAWEDWLDEMKAYRARFAALLGVPDARCVVPKTSAGQGVRAVLNAFDGVPHVVATRGEFDSVDVILREYALRGRIRLTLVVPREQGLYNADDVRAALGPGVDLVVLSSVVFNTGQRIPELAALVAEARGAGARVLLDVYHEMGVLPLDIAAVDADFAVGGSYKYLRGGPGACFLYLHSRVLDGSFRTLDIGWFAKADRFTYQRPDPPALAEGGDAWLESTPAILPFYQARAGQLFTLALGVSRLRSYCLDRLRHLRRALDACGIASEGADDAHGGFLVVRLQQPRAQAWVADLARRGVRVDARGEYVRFCPDLLTSSDEIGRAAMLAGESLRRFSAA